MMTQLALKRARCCTPNPDEALRIPRARGIAYVIGRVDERTWREVEFACAIRRSPRARIRRGWIKTYQPVLDDAPYRIFPSMRQYSRWCQARLPSWLGYGKAA